MKNFKSIKQIESLRHQARTIVRELGLLGDVYHNAGITLAERHLLIELKSAIYPTMSYVASRLLLDKSTVSRLVAKAVKKKFVSYATDNTDKRRRCLQLTEHGKAILDVIEPLAQKQISDALATITENERRIVHQGLSYFSKALTQARLKNEKKKSNQ